MEYNHTMDRWLMELEESLASSAASSPEQAPQNPCRFSYLLSRTTAYSSLPSIKIQVKVVFARASKFGKLSAYKPLDSTKEAHQKLLDNDTKALLLQLKGMRTFYNYKNFYRDDDIYELIGNEGEAILLKLIATGCCYWKNDKKELPSNKDVALQLSQEKKAEWHWRMNDDGKQTLYFHNEKETLHLFAIKHAWYCNEQSGEIGIIQTGVPLKVLPSLLGLSKVPMEQAEKIANILKKHSKEVPLELPKVPIVKKVKKIKPVPCLRLFQTPVRCYADHGRNTWVILSELQPAAELAFDYNGILGLPNDQKESLSYIKNDELFSIQRDSVEEKKLTRALTSSGWRFPVNMPYPFAKMNPDAPSCFFFDLENGDPLKFSGHVLPQLEADGWRITIDEDYPYQFVDADIDEWYSELDERSSYDWFGLELGVTLKGKKINLLPVLQKVLQKLKQQQLLNPSQSAQDFINQETFFAEIANGRYIQLPAERLKNILNIFIELYDSDSLSDDNKLRLSKLHAVRLIELEKAMGAAQLRWIGGERLRLMGKKLSEFKGITAVEPPSEFKGILRPYQLEGLSWLQFLREYDLSGILADDMGLGKTVQALAHLLVEKMSGRMQGPSLIVAPTSLMFNWQMEAERFAPDLKVLLLHGNERKNCFDEISNYDLILTTYPLISRDRDTLLKQDFYYLILDEAQCIKNAKSLAAQTALQLKAKHRLCLTGTPMENHLGELWSLFHFMTPGLLGDQKQFTRLFRTPIEKQADYERRVHLNRRVAPFLLRRTKDKVLEELPEKVEMIRHVELDGPQRDLYETIRLSMQKKVREQIAQLGLTRSHIIILDALLKLRQVCCDPRLLKIPTAQKKQASSAKLELLMSTLKELLEEGRRILLFSQFTEMLGLIEEELHKEQISYVKLTGQTQDRKTPVQEFQEGKVPLFLISLKAGGTGLNLTAADTVIHYDPWWNPAVENQATDRAHRIGQNKTVFVYKFVAKGTVEERILEMQKNKHALMEGLFSEAKTNKLQMTEKDLQGLFEPLE